MVKQQNSIYHFCARKSIPKHQTKVDGEALVPVLESWLRGIGADKFIFQLENSWLELSPEKLIEKQAEANKDRHPPMIYVNHNLHHQIYFHTKEKTRPSTLIKMVNEIPELRGMHISAASNNGKNALKNYCMKKETRVAGPWADTPVYLGADLISLDMMTPPQKKLLDYLIKCDPVKYSKRECIWICDPEGGSGKSAFKKFCSYHYKWPGFSYASAKDILFIVSKFQNRRVYFFNLSKTRSADVSENELYAALESIKDGDFTSTKYVPENVLMNPCHVVIFANHWPRKGLLTRGRLKLIKWDPLPDHLVMDKFEFDWNCAGMRVVDMDELPDDEPPLKKQKTSDTVIGEYVVWQDQEGE